MLASLAHLYMPHLFTHCLPTIICVTLMSIVFFIFAIGYATFICDSILACLWTYFLFRFYFCVIPCDCYNFVLSPSPLFFHAIYVSDLIPLPQIFDGVGMMKHVCVFVEKFAPNNSCHSTSSFLLPPNWTAEEWLSTLNETCKNELKRKLYPCFLAITAHMGLARHHNIFWWLWFALPDFFVAYAYEKHSYKK